MASEDLNYRRLREETQRWGGDLFGVAHLAQIHLVPCSLDEKVLKELPFGISIGIRLADGVLDDIYDHPTLIYLHHYRQANYILDRIAFNVSALIQRIGGKALPIAASQTVDWEQQRGHLSHKGLARAAGIGWLGRNNLIVHPQYGARIRLASILTDLPLPTNEPVNDTCGKCSRCVSVCPASAIKMNVEEFDHLGCFEKLKEFRKKYNIGHYICGVCVKACQPKQ